MTPKWWHAVVSSGGITAFGLVERYLKYLEDAAAAVASQDAYNALLKAFVESTTR